MEKLLASFRANEPLRRIPKTERDASDLIRISGEIESVLSTLLSINKHSGAFTDLREMVISGRTPDNAFFGPVPSLSGGGVGVAAGVAADLGSALVAVVKGARAEKKMLSQVTADPSQLKRQMMHNYCEMALLLSAFVERASASETEANQLHKRGLNVHILNNAWAKVKLNQWLVFAA